VLPATFVERLGVGPERAADLVVTVSVSTVRQEHVELEQSLAQVCKLERRAHPPSWASHPEDVDIVRAELHGMASPRSIVSGHPDPPIRPAARDDLLVQDLGRRLGPEHLEDVLDIPAPDP
jgi:hypothetical protein